MKKISVNENTSVGLPLKNLFSLIAAIVIGAWFAFGVLERLNNLETADILFKEDLLKQIESIEKEIEASRYNKVNIDHLKEQITAITKQIDKLRNGH